MNSEDSLKALLASTGGDTVKLFDLSLEPRDPCILSYTPSPGFQVNSVKWNHTNLVVASAGDDKKISFWRKNGQSLGTVPMGGADGADNIEAHPKSLFTDVGPPYYIVHAPVNEAWACGGVLSIPYQKRDGHDNQIGFRSGTSAVIRLDAAIGSEVALHLGRHDNQISGWSKMDKN
ncbi:hypothetical protein FXO37_19636 [Capsicum annuum]|nr:hypothetical protein FXO37_19636 [Capsicum annuum]